MFKALAILSLATQSIFPSYTVTPTTVVQPRHMPQEVRAIYATANTAELIGRMAELTKLIQDTELNAIVINTKEPSGLRLNPALKKIVSDLHSKNIWVIARQVVFQDDDLVKRRPDLALKNSGENMWRDRGGRAWLDPASPEVWEYNVKIARDTLKFGFDEINLDYIRFPTDGNTKNIKYPFWNNQTPKDETIKNFLHYFKREIKTTNPSTIISGDLFGQVFLKDSDMGMGQRVKLLALELDVLAPMAYPSHYASGNFGFTKPAEHPYEVMKQTLVAGLKLLPPNTSTQIRPWLQDFDLGADYTPPMVRDQIKAVKEAGPNNGWMLWNAKNIYTETALSPDN